MNLIPEHADESNCQTLFGFRAELEQILNFLNYKENPNLTDFFGTTLLHFAVIDNCDNFVMVEKLIKAGANVNAQNNCKQTPLHLAVLRRNCRVMDTLIAYDADINIQELKGNTVLHSAIDMIWSKRSDRQKTRSWIVKKLLHCGADPNISNADGETPLMVAIKNGDLDVVKDLLAFGANVHFRNRFSETCLHLFYSCPKPDTAILNELVKHGACVNCCDDIGRTALDVSLESNDTVIDSLRMKLVQPLIKISTLVNWKCKTVFQVTCKNREKLRSSEEFVDACYTEVSRMKSCIYPDGSTLCHFAINGVEGAKKDKYQISLFDEVLNTLTKDEFPIYDDLIEAHFDTAFLKEKLFEMNIYARNTKGEVRLHPYAILHIVSYLSVRDLLNLVRAYSKPYNNSLSNDKINWFAEC